MSAHPTGCQRWREGRASYRPAREVIRTTGLDVVELPDDTTPRAFVERHHYARSYPSARWRFALYDRGTLAGVAVFSHPAEDAVLVNAFPGLADPARDAVELGRLVLLDEIGANAESWMVARCFAALRAAGVRAVLSHSDPVPRSTDAGVVVLPGHVGTVYQALNAAYLGRSTPRTLRLFPDGTVWSARAMQKVRAGERGWRGVVAHLAGYGATPLAGDAGPAERLAWVRATASEITRPLRHHGNHRYAWALDRRARRAMSDATRAYPKLQRAA